jgi:hypothetical protein
MNIIELYEKLSFGKSELQDLTDEKRRTIENRLLEINSAHTDTTIATDLVEVLKNHPNEFLFVINTREWYNFFTQTNYGQDQFPFHYNMATNNDKMQEFVELYLKSSLVFLANQSIEQNQFEGLAKLLENKSFIPKKVVDSWNNQAMVKMDYALARIDNSINQLAAIGFIKNRYFYDFLSHFKSIELDEKIRLLSFRMEKIFKRNSRLVVAHETFFALSYYQPFEQDLRDILQRNRSKVEFKKANVSSNESGRGFVVKFLISIISLVGVGLFLYRISQISFFSKDVVSDKNKSEQEPVLDRYYTNMKPKVDSLNKYLADYDQSSCLNLHYLDTLKTGDNPFKFLFNNDSYGKESTGIVIYNQSGYDVVLFEKAVQFDSIKMPQQAIFVRSKQSIELTTLGEVSNRVFSVYTGKKMATFHAKGELPIVYKNSVEEPRFKELASNSKSLLSKDYFLNNDLYITSENGTVVLNSKSLVEFTMPSK